MKRFYLSIALLVALLAAILPASFVAADDGEGNPVSPDVAKQVAANLLNTLNLHNTMQKGLELAEEPIEPKLDVSSLSEVFVETKNGKDVYYIINMNPEGWVIVSADYVAYPIIGCSDTGSYSPENHPPAFDSWMENVKEEIYQAITGEVTPLEEATEAWQVLNAPT
ncbi:MAG: Spi family protease inhibitor [Dehalococcoidia bacterium]|nr:Spi family protease inhibitor [Dehalococcoidia bacterium]